MEAARRVESLHGIAFAEIDATGIMPLKLCSSDTDGPGLLSTYARRSVVLIIW